MVSRVQTHGVKSTDFTSSHKHGTRKGSISVPCDDCIQNASKGTNSASNQLCETCLDHLHRPRRRQQQAANVGKIRRRFNAITDTALGLPPKSIPLPWNEDHQIQRSLQFFIYHSAPQLAGYFDSRFWQQMMLHSGSQSPAVKHAIAAIGALHERLLTGPDNKDSGSPRKRGFALECNQSIQHLMKPTNGEQSDLRLLLATCILFTCFEAMQGHCEQAMSHAKQGHALLDQYATDPRNRPCELGAFVAELDQLCMMVQKLQTESKGLLAKEHHTVGEDFGVGGAPQPAYFDTLHAARVSLEKMINHSSIFFLDLDLNEDFYEMVRDSPHKCLSLTALLEAWEQAFSRLLARKELRPSEQKSAMVLESTPSRLRDFEQCGLLRMGTRLGKVSPVFHSHRRPRRICARKILPIGRKAVEKSFEHTEYQSLLQLGHLGSPVRSMPRSIASSKSPRSACLPSQARVLVEIVICAESGKIPVAP
jgi:hypothetical protein